MRFCEWNIKNKGSIDMINFQRKHNSDIVNIEILQCLGNCTICSQGPFCTVNDFLFQEETVEGLNHFLNDLVDSLRDELEKISSKES